MPKKIQPEQVYKTESQLKEESLAKYAAEAKASAAVNKSELQKKSENFWYHYKWQTIACVFAAFLIVFFVKDMVLRTKPDVTVIVVSESFFDTYELSHLIYGLENYATDYNGDGKVAIVTDFISLPRLEDDHGQNGPPTPDLTGGQQEMASAMKLMAVIAAGTDPIYLLDEASYNYIVSMSRGEDAEDGGEADNIFEAFSIPAEKLLDTAPVGSFRGMRFYLRTAYSDERYYQYCEQLLRQLDR